MTKQQRITLMADWWPKACAVQGWDKSDRDARLRALSDAVGRPLASASDLNNTTDVDKVRAHLARLADNVGGMMKHETPSEDEAVRWRYVVNRQIGELAPYLELKEGETPLRAALQYAAQLVRDKFGLAAEFSDLRLKDLGLAQLKQLKVTLTERTKAAKKATVSPF